MKADGNISNYLCCMFKSNVLYVDLDVLIIGVDAACSL